MQNFQELNVWKKAHALVLQVYKVSKDLPQSENFGLVLNLRRSATSMATRVAEGAGRASSLEFAGDLNRSRATGYELEYLLLVARDLGFMQAEVHDSLVNDLVEVRKMTSGLIKTLANAP